MCNYINDKALLKMDDLVEFIYMSVSACTSQITWLNMLVSAAFIY